MRNPSILTGVVYDRPSPLLRPAPATGPTTRTVYVTWPSSAPLTCTIRTDTHAAALPIVAAWVNDLLAAYLAAGWVPAEPPASAVQPEWARRPSSVWTWSLRGVWLQLQPRAD